jgi:uncharacterized membrane protein YebE (DUF533 family)
MLEFLKENKKKIIKRTLIIGGTIAGLILAGKVLSDKKEDVETVEFPEETTTEVTAE